MTAKNELCSVLTQPTQPNLNFLQSANSSTGCAKGGEVSDTEVPPREERLPTTPGKYKCEFKTASSILASSSTGVTSSMAETSGQSRGGFSRPTTGFKSARDVYAAGTNAGIDTNNSINTTTASASKKSPPLGSKRKGNFSADKKASKKFKRTLSPTEKVTYYFGKQPRGESVSGRATADETLLSAPSGSTSPPSRPDSTSPLVAHSNANSNCNYTISDSSSSDSSTGCSKSNSSSSVRSPANLADSTSTPSESTHTVSDSTHAPSDSSCVSASHAAQEGGATVTPNENWPVIDLTSKLCLPLLQSADMWLFLGRLRFSELSVLSHGVYFLFMCT